MDIRGQVKSRIVMEGMTMKGVVEALAEKKGWSRSKSNFTGKLKRGTIRYTEILDVADVLGYEIIWQKKVPREEIP